MSHAVHRLRDAREARATRPFLARGGNSERCRACRMPVDACVCDRRPPPRPTRAGFCLLLHGSEVLKPSNTGWLVADVVPDTAAFQWSRTAPDRDLLRLLADPAWEPVLVFPAESGAPPRPAPSCLRAGAAARPLFVILDATWAEARRMFRKSPYLDALPAVSFAPAEASRSPMRRSDMAGSLCTAEVAARCLRMAGDAGAALALDAWLDCFVAATMRVRGQAPSS